MRVVNTFHERRRVWEDICRPFPFYGINLTLYTVKKLNCHSCNWLDAHKLPQQKSYQDITQWKGKQKIYMIQVHWKPELPCVSYFVALLSAPIISLYFLTFAVGVEFRDIGVTVLSFYFLYGWGLNENDKALLSSNSFRFSCISLYENMLIKSNSFKLLTRTLLVGWCVLSPFLLDSRAGAWAELWAPVTGSILC